MKSSLGRRIVLILSVLLFITTLLVTGISYHYSAQAIRREILESSGNMLTITGKNLEDYMNEISAFSLTPLVDSDFINAMYQEPDHFEQIIIENKLKNMALSREDISSLRYYNAISQETFLLNAEHKKVSILRDDRIGQSFAFQKAAASEKYESIETLSPIPVLVDEGQKEETVIFYHRIFINIRTRQPVGMLTIGINAKHWFDSILYALSQNGEAVTLLTEENKIVCTNDAGTIPVKEELLSQSSGKQQDAFIKIAKKTPDGGFELVKLIPERYISDQLKNLRAVIFGWCILVSVFLVVVVYFIVIRMTRPLKRLAEHMENSTGIQLALFPIGKSRDEVGMLTEKFNQMAENMNRLINSEYKARISEQEARLEALEAQVNPHFLSNALQAISTSVWQNDPMRTNKMLVALGHLIDFSFRGAAMVTVREELQYVNYYFTLIQGRFDERFCYTVQVEDDCLNRTIPKFTIQGLAENTIKHVLEKSTQQVIIQVKVFLQEGNMLIEVKDNGGGICPDILAKLQGDASEASENRSAERNFTDGWIMSGQAEQHRHSGGLKNLKARLELVYGARADFAIRSDTDGTYVMITIRGE